MNAETPFSLQDQTLLVVGLAREGAVAARWLAEQGARVRVSDLRAPAELAPALAPLLPLGVELAAGPQTPDLLAGVAAVIVSPGVPQDIPLLQAARALGLPVTTETRLFAQQCPGWLIGITGSSGKTTTSTLAARILTAAGLRVWLGGNIGAPLLGELPHIAPAHRVVMELSSFQLLYWGAQAPAAPPDSSSPWQQRGGISPGIAAVLNITPNHLDRHPSMAHYAAAKANILASQSRNHVAVLSHDDPITAGWARRGRVEIAAGGGQEAVSFPLAAAILSFGLTAAPAGPAGGSWVDAQGQIWLRWQGNDHRILPAQALQLRGRHNLSNVLAAICVAAAAGAGPEAMAATIGAFTGVPHRLEVARRLGGVLWVNDSIATSPERAVAAIHSFDEPLILLAGGRDKHLPWQEWAAAVHRRVKHVIAFGEIVPLAAAALSPRPADSHLQEMAAAENLAAAVELAATLARPGDVVLLSPGGVSFDAYTDFAARGQHFCQLVHALPSPQEFTLPTETGSRQEAKKT